MDYFIERIVTRANMPIPTVFGDLTIGDFWGLGEEVPFHGDTQNGISVVLVNNEKGAKFFNEIKDKIFFEKRTVSEAIKGNTQLRHASEKHQNYHKFLEIYSERGLKEALEKTL